MDFSNYLVSITCLISWDIWYRAQIVYLKSLTLALITTKKQWSIWQNMFESKRDKWQKINRFLNILLSIRTFPVKFLSLWTIFYQFYVIYHVLIQTCLCQYDHCFLVVYMCLRSYFTSQQLYLYVCLNEAINQYTISSHVHMHTIYLIWRGTIVEGLC